MYGSVSLSKPSNNHLSLGSGQ